MRLRDAGEFGVIERLAAAIGTPSGSATTPAAPELRVGIGDDAAVWVQGDVAHVATTDMLVEGVHFDHATTGWRDLGWKALAVNLSDVAAMGATPSFAFVSLGLTEQATVEDVEALYQGMRALAEQTGCTVAGGDIVGSPEATVINVTALGYVPANEADTLMRRDQGVPGDLVAVTGVLGASAAGLYALQHEDSVSLDDRAALARHHLQPNAQIAAGQALRDAGVHCAMDVSDGLIADLEKLCAASGVGATVQADALPLLPLAKALYPERAVEWAASGGEDYQLLFTAQSAVMARASAGLAQIGVASTVVGELEAAPGVRLVDDAGHSVTLASRGWDHFGTRAEGVGA